MATVGKCSFCEKRVYELEAFKYGPPGNALVAHKACLKCQNPGCSWKLDARNYHYWEGKIYCKAHNAMTGTSNQDHAAKGTFDKTLELDAALNAPKQDVVRANLVSPRDNNNNK